MIIIVHLWLSIKNFARDLRYVDRPDLFWFEAFLIVTRGVLSTFFVTYFSFFYFRKTRLSLIETLFVYRKPYFALDFVSFRSLLGNILLRTFLIAFSDTFPMNDWSINRLNSKILV